MPEKFYFYLFILCAVLFQEIVGTFFEDNVEESSNVLVREKRVINRKPGEDVPVNIGAAAYAVNIKKQNRLHCMGAILSHHTVITAARCITLELSMYKVMSGSTYSHKGATHNITEKKMHGHHPSRSSTFLSGIALLTIIPPFVYSLTTESIDLHARPVLGGMRGIVSGFASYYYGGPRESQYSTRLRSIIVPIMDHRECVNIYRGLFEIGDEDICTYHEERLCGYTDTGAPLVMDHELVGIYIGGIDTGDRECPIKPDVFVLLQHLEYGQWIRRNIVV